MINPEIASKVVELFSEMAQSHYDIMIEADHIDKITDMEWDIVKYVGRGMSNKEIASHLYISVNTVITHRRNIARKLNIHSVAGLTIYAFANGLIDKSCITSE